MKKILFVIRSLEFGGAEKSLVNLLQALPEDRYEIHLLLFKQKGEFLSQLPQNVRLLQTPKALGQLFAPLKKAGIYAPCKLVGTLWARFHGKTRKARMGYRWRHFYSKATPRLEGRYDVAVAYVGTEVFYYVMDKVQANRKYVWIHNDYRTAAYSKPDDAPYFQQVDGIVSVSADCVRVLQEEFPQFTHKIHKIENITSAAVVQALGNEDFPREYVEGACNILSVGRLSRQKGFDMAIEAVAKLKERGICVHWFIIGQGDQEQVLRSLIDQRNVADRVHLLGTRINPYPYMKHCTFLAQPSRFEGKSVVLDEAKILCVPILATAYPTVADQLCHGQEGWIVPMDSDGIAEGIETLLQDGKILASITQFLEARSWDNSGEVEKYRKLLDGEL